MKIKYFIGGLFAAVFTFASCEDPDNLERTDSVSANQLVIKAAFASNLNNELSAEIDEDKGTVSFKVPYYISEVAPIQADMTKMKLLASLPVGAVFQPSLVGIHNLQEGFSSTLVYDDGRKIAYTFKAAYVKSNVANITKVELTKTRATVKIVHPQGSEKGKIQILETTGSIDPEKLEEATIQVSPWATVETEFEGIYDKEKGQINLSSLPTVTVVAQNGVDKSVYVTELTLPEMVGLGEIGYISNMFGFQVYQDEPRGFEMDANRTMAVVDSYLVLANSTNFNRMAVLDRYSGALRSDIKVNCTGIPANRSIRAITTDDAGHMVAMAFTSTYGPESGQGSAESKVLVWVWKNGIQQAPTLIMSNDIKEPIFQGVHFIGTTISIKGDLTAGDAVMGTHSPWTPRPVLLQFKDGALQNVVVEWRCSAAYGQFGQSSKVSPLTATASPNLSYIADAGAGASQIYFVPSEAGVDGWLFNTDLEGAHIYPPTAPQGGWIISNDYVEFNGMKLLAVMSMASLQASAAKFVVSDISDLNAMSLKSKVIFSSQGGRDGLGDGVPGAGFTVTGYTSGDSFNPTRTVFGQNSSSTGDIVFAKSEDGKILHVYMLSTNNGLLAYEITLYKL